MRGDVYDIAMETKQANQVIQQLEVDYNQIAEHFSSTRHDAWPEFELLKTLITSLETTSELSLLDLGCGNGRLAAALPHLNYTGLDLSAQLLTIARQKFPDYTFVHGSMLQLPFTDAQFDLVACVAALQHIPSVNYRQQAVKEMYRVLKPGGTVFMLNWNLAEQPQYQAYLASPQAGYDTGDYLIPWKTDQGTIQANRYYHGFTTPEIAELLEQAAFIISKNELGADRRNLLTIAQKR